MEYPDTNYRAACLALPELSEICCVNQLNHSVSNNCLLYFSAPWMVAGHVMDHSAVKGFSLIELLVVMALLVILAGIGVPALWSLQQQFQVRSVSQQLQQFIHATKAAAIGNNATAVLCKTDFTEPLMCSDDPVDWNYRWLIFVDINNNRQPDGDDELLTVAQQVPDQCVIKANRQRIIFKANGLINSSSGTFTVVCGDYQRSVVINFLGRVRLSELMITQVG